MNIRNRGKLQCCLIQFVDSPSPDHYDLKSSFEKSYISLQNKKGHNNSFCFGTGREAFTKVVMPGKLNQPDPCVPGPGQYDYIKQIGHDRRKLSMGPKYNFNDITVMEMKKNVPGPGFY